MLHTLAEGTLQMVAVVLKVVVMGVHIVGADSVSLHRTMQAVENE